MQGNQQDKEKIMTEEQIRLLLSLGRDEARLLLDNAEYYLYRRIQKQMVDLVRDYDVRLPLNCLQFMYCGNRLRRPGTSGY
jgi:hypothetical protein